MPAHKLIGQKSKLNLAFDIEYKIVDSYDPSDFKPRHHMIREQKLGIIETFYGTFSITCYFVYDLGYLLLMRSGNIPIENYTQKSDRDNMRHNSVGNANAPWGKSPYEQEIKPFSLPTHGIEQNPLSDKPGRNIRTSRDNKQKDRDPQNRIPFSYGTDKNQMAHVNKKPELPNQAKIQGSLSTSSPRSSPNIGPPALTITEDPFILETPAFPSFNLQLASFSPFRDNPMSRSPFSDIEDPDELSGFKSMNLTPVFMVSNWKEMGISPVTRSMMNSTRIAVSTSPVLPTEAADSETTKLDQFTFMLQNPPDYLLKEIDTMSTVAEYKSTLDKLIGT